jgi:hypothetical protein
MRSAPAAPAIGSVTSSVPPAGRARRAARRMPWRRGVVVVVEHAHQRHHVGTLGQRVARGSLRRAACTRSARPRPGESGPGRVGHPRQVEHHRPAVPARVARASATNTPSPPPTSSRQSVAVRRDRRRAPGRPPAAAWPTSGPNRGPCAVVVQCRRRVADVA